MSLSFILASSAVSFSFLQLLSDNLPLVTMFLFCSMTQEWPVTFSSNLQYNENLTDLQESIILFVRVK